MNVAGSTTRHDYCGECGMSHVGDCGPDPDGSYPCVEGHYGCSSTLRGPCSDAPICGWFLLCGRPAVTTVPHPVLGDVPCCDRCATFALGPVEAGARIVEAAQAFAKQRRDRMK